ncbi:DNA-binding XRE family transcriptional regulator [Phyllobacterium ifriqiyense]|uniref:DNA-binding XRE family transcriptional regulator n=1 Tax=Phyllobacterium ifriqiyense TaxID=314238 RepID=A0ABU0S6K2_9HYPH|nr:helix-turn-helix transcriptional regulator [Phyllobacterium ifriqiyense]MDQ0996394.1 DNA-binding XRE family transcriptional regulator [Phyllobacterium ifriqiyense]
MIEAKMGELKVSYIMPPGSDQRYAMISEDDFLALKAIVTRLDDVSLGKDSHSIKELVEALNIRDAIARGDEETFPEDVVFALVQGENPVRVFRKWRGMTAVALSQAAGISQPYLSEIENGSKDGSLSVMKRIATILNVTLDDLAG